MYCHTSSSVQLEIGKTRACSPLRIRPLYRLHSSGRWRWGSHWPNSSRKDRIRSLARARSSSRRAPPKAASKSCSAIASSSVTVCSRLRDARGPVSSTTRPLSIDSCTLATISRSPSSATRRSRNSITSGKLCPVSTCISGNGNGAGRNAFSARRSSTIESLPPLNSSTGRSNSAATSRITWIASDSSARRWLSWGRAATLMSGGIDGLYVDAALGLVRARPAALATRARLRARRAADRLVAAVVQRVVGEVALVDPAPQVLVAPVRERVVLPQAALAVAFDQLGARTRRPLLATYAGDPALRAVQRPPERRYLRRRAAVLGAAPRLAGAARVEHLDAHAEALLERTPRLHRLLEQHARVDRRDPHRAAGALVQAQQLVEQHRLLLLEGAQQDRAPAVAGSLAQRVGKAQRRVVLHAHLRCVAV